MLQICLVFRKNWERKPLQGCFKRQCQLIAGKLGLGGKLPYRFFRCNKCFVVIGKSRLELCKSIDLVRKLGKEMIPDLRIDRVITYHSYWRLANIAGRGAPCWLTADPFILLWTLSMLDCVPGRLAAMTCAILEECSKLQQSHVFARQIS